MTQIKPCGAATAAAVATVEPEAEPKPVRPLGVDHARIADTYNITAAIAAKKRLDQLGFDKSYFAMLEGCSQTGSAVATQMTNLRSNDESWQARLDLIDGAKTCIVLSNYTIGADERGLALLDRLIAAAARGVKILGTQTWLTSEIANRFVLGDPAVRGANYEAYQRKLADLESYGAFFTYHGKIGDTLRHGFHGNHWKALCVDGEQAIVGGRNVVGFHFDPKVDMGDMEMILKGPIAHKLSEETLRVINNVSLAKNAYTQVFNRPAWLDETKRDISAALLQAKDRSDAALAALPALEREHLPRFYPIVWDPIFDSKKKVENKVSRAMLETIRRASKGIILTQNYLNPPELFLKELTAAALRGVKVKILTTGQKDSGLSVWPYITASVHYQQFVAAGAEIYETDGLPEHSKILVVDNAVAAFGSFNVEIAADQALVEGMCFCAAPNVVLLLKAAALDAILAGRRIDADELTRMNVPKKFRLFDRVMARLTKPYL